jgi:acylphosphatase
MRKVLSFVRCDSGPNGIPASISLNPIRGEYAPRYKLPQMKLESQPAMSLVQSRRAVAETRQAKRFFVTGEVQGVGFRYFAKRAAEWLGLSGYVRNLEDGRVEVYGIGPRVQLGELRRELEHGPLGANVEDVSEEPAELEQRFLERFSIERDA